MGSRNKETVSNSMKLKNPKNKRTKFYLEFNEEKRKEFLTGFRKRKNERKKKGKEIMEQKLKDEMKRIKDKQRRQMQQRMAEVMSVVGGDSSTKSKIYTLPQHTVTVSDISVDLLQTNQLLLGSNQDLDRKTEENVDDPQESGGQNHTVSSSKGGTAKPDKSAKKKLLKISHRINKSKTKKGHQRKGKKGGKNKRKRH